MAACSPNLISLKRFFKSPIWTCEFTTPNSNNSLYASWAAGVLSPSFNKPETSIPSLNAFENSTGLNKLPFAPTKPNALTKLRICVGTDNTVLANWETPFGNNNKFLYIQLTAASAPSLFSPLTNPWSPPPKLFICFIPSDISSVVNLGKGIEYSPPPGNCCTKPSFLPAVSTILIPVLVEFTAFSAASLVSQKNPLLPSAWTAAFLRPISFI